MRGCRRESGSRTFETESKGKSRRNGTAGIERGGRLSDARQFMARLAANLNSAAGRSLQPKRGHWFRNIRAQIVRRPPAGIIQTPIRKPRESAPARRLRGQKKGAGVELQPLGPPRVRA